MQTKRGLAAAGIIFVVLFLLILIGTSLATRTSKNPVVTDYSTSKSEVRQTSLKENQETKEDKVDKLEKYLTVQAALMGVSDNVSLYFRDFKKDKEVSIDPTRSWIPASTIKSYVALEAFRQRRLGLIDFNDQVTIKADNVVPTELETDEFPRLREGVVVTIKQLVEGMIEQSDNIAYNSLLDILDRRNINLTLKNLGITETVVGEKLNLDDDQFQKDLKMAGRQPNTTTAKDLATIFNLLYLKKVPDSEEMLSIFKKQKINYMIPSLLPENVEVAHKTGEWAPIYHDGGIVLKPEQPFILSVFTNSNNPHVVAKLAEVAYFQNAQAVGDNITQASPKITSQSPTKPKIFLASIPSQTQILGITTNDKFPKVTAADLGISANDLNPEIKKAGDIKAALITSGSIFYDLKRLFERIKLALAKTDSQKIRIHLSLATYRLSEVKTSLKKNDIKTADRLLNEAEDNLEKATNIAKVTLDEPNILEIRLANNTHFATLLESSKDLGPEKKEEYVDAVYKFYKRNKSEVKPLIKNTFFTSSLDHEPIIGTINKIEENKITVQFDNGKTKEIIINDSIPIRGFKKNNYDRKNILKEGSRIAVMAQTGPKEELLATFILRDVPKELPDQHKGIVTEIDPSKNSLKILDNQGRQQEIKIDNDTIIKSRDTTVSLDGIKAGSQITVFGEPQESPGANKQPAALRQELKKRDQDKKRPFKATTVIVTQNSSGSQEQKNPPKHEELKKPEMKQEEPKNKKGDSR